ncbi:MAG: TonB-dependent receptor [Pseudomonadales bacterium]
MHLRVSVLLLVAYAGCWAQTARAAAEPLADIVARLAALGHPITFSTDLVSPGALVEVSEDSPAALIRALTPLGLTLERVDERWVITRATDAAPSVSRLTIRSAQNLPLEDAEARWRGRALPLQEIADGVYRIPLAAGNVVSIRASQHRPQLVRLDRSSREVVLEPLQIIENVIVTGTRHRLSGRSITGSVTTLDAEELATIPTLGNDAMRALAQLPGMSSVGFSAKPRIRGGVSDELLVRLDGVELLDAYHLADFQNVFSVVDDRAVQSVDVYTGGFPARYGNRMSGVMDINTGPVARERRTEIGISVFSLLANTQGTFGEDGDTSYLVSLRRGNLDLITKQLNPSLGEPRYHDAFARLDHDLTANARLSGGLFYTKDDVRLTEDETSAGSKIDTRYVWTQLALDHGNGLDSTSTLTYTWSDREKSLFDEDDEDPREGFLDHRQTLRKVNVRSDLSWQLSRLLTEFGAEIEYGSSRYDSVAEIERGVLGELLESAAGDGHDIQLDPDGFSGGAYWALEVPVGETLVLQPGIRWDFQSFDPAGSTYHTSPRIGLRWRPRDTVSVRIDAGRFHQPEALHELQVADGETAFFRPQKSDHFIIGGEWLTAGGWALRGELYEKRYSRVKRRYENLLNPFVLVPELEPDRIAINPDRARARGVDLDLRRDLSDRAELRLHYSYMDAEDHLDGFWIPRRWSQEHTASAMVSWRGERLTAALAVTWHSGWRGAELPEEVALGDTLAVPQVLNNLELRDFVSLDASVRRSWQIGRSEVTAFASITNLTNRENVAGIDYSAELDDGVVLLEPARETLLPLVPSVGVLISF